jgi:hypothetical protein
MEYDLLLACERATLRPGGLVCLVGGDCGGGNVLVVKPGSVYRAWANAVIAMAVCCRDRAGT